MPDADFVVLCTGLRADFRCYSRLGGAIQRAAVRAQGLPLVGAGETAAKAFVDSDVVTRMEVPVFAKSNQDVYGEMPIPIKYLREEVVTHSGAIRDGTFRRGIFFVGPRGGKYYSQPQLRKIFNKEIQKVLEIGENLVSIFLLAPITAQTAAYLNSRWSAKSFGHSLQWQKKLDAVRTRKRVSLKASSSGATESAKGFVCGAVGPAMYVQKETRLLGTMGLDFVAARLLIVLWKYFSFAVDGDSSGGDWTFKILVRGCVHDSTGEDGSVLQSQSERLQIMLSGDGEGWSFGDVASMESMRRCFVVREGLLLALIRDQLTEESDEGGLIFSRDRLLEAVCTVDGSSGVLDVRKSVVMMKIF